MNMKYKLLIIAGALGVTGAAVGGGLYLAYPVQVTTLAGYDAQLSSFLVGASRHDNHGIERGLQSTAAAPSPAAEASSPSAPRRLAEL